MNVIYGIVVPELKKGEKHKGSSFPTLGHRLTSVSMPARLEKKIANFSLTVDGEKCCQLRVFDTCPRDNQDEARVEFLPIPAPVVEAGWEVSISFDATEESLSDGITFHGDGFSQVVVPRIDDKWDSPAGCHFVVIAHDNRNCVVMRDIDDGHLVAVDVEYDLPFWQKKGTE